MALKKIRGSVGIRNHDEVQDPEAKYSPFSLRKSERREEDLEVVDIKKKIAKKRTRGPYRKSAPTKGED